MIGGKTSKGKAYLPVASATNVTPRKGRNAAHAPGLPDNTLDCAGKSDATALWN
jgi:hypothetical protein